ncbi:MAG: tripartite tricarboxylate transporter substrate binding protein [Comamonadaceae bacterium]|nr:tripartite tricarboxylate transporter substrate binding protein [Comamonadaceae bacterium]
MKILRTLTFAALSSAMALVHAADPYPSKSIELVVAYAAGGGSDAAARAIAEAAKKHLPQPVYVTNKPGASGSIGWAYVTTGTPDGYKLSLMNPEMLVVPLLGIGKTTVEHFQPIARFTDDATSITVRADAPWKTIDEFIAFARANPEKVAVSNAGLGTIPHTAAVALAERTNAKFNHVPYQGAAPATLGLLSGDVQATSIPYADLKQHVEAGKLRTLAVMADKRIAGLDNIPTFKERGYDLQYSVWRGIGLPKGSPKEALDKWREVAKAVFQDPAFQTTITKQGLTLSWADTPEFTTDIARQNEAFKKIVPKMEMKQ